MSDAINPDHYKRLPSEAIEIIEAMISGAPDNKAAYLHGQGAKYDLRLWEKGESLEDYLSDLRKHIWYSLRLESHLLELIEKQKAGEHQIAADPKEVKNNLEPDSQEVTGEVAGEVTGEVKPPDGWRWVRKGELIRNGDKPKNGDAAPKFWIGTPCCNNQFILRRNKFQVGEKVVHGGMESPWISTVEKILRDGWVQLVRNGVLTSYHVNDLAPYIEETT